MSFAVDTRRNETCSDQVLDQCNHKRNQHTIQQQTCKSSLPGSFFSNHVSWKDKWKRQKIETLALLLKGALEAEAKVGLKMNIEERNLQSLLDSLPALRRPTISGLSQKGWVAVETIIDEHVVRELIPALKAAGAEGIIEYPLNKVVY